MSLDWIYDWVLLALPGYGAENILRAKQGITIPTDPFITYQVLSLDASGFEFKNGDSALYPDPDVTPEVLGTFDRTYQQNCPIKIQIDCYSPQGMTDLQTAISCARSMDEVKEIFNDARCSFLGCEGPKNLDFLSDNDYRDRWMVTCDFMIALTRTEARYAILEWEISGEIDGLIDPLTVTIEA
jgi:hypothetical protein